jgi:molybdopterin-guanine dinucleotide biosynthesis protein A
MNSSLGPITGILLAGGKSQRMGREKGTLEIGNRLMYEYPLEVLETICEEILISSCSDQPSLAGHQVVCDEIKGIGPMGGIHSCLGQSPTDLNIVLSYDMPLISEGLLRHLVAESHGWDAVIPALHQDKPEPLCAVYRKSVLGAFRDLIKKKQYAVHQVIPMIKSRVLIIDDTMAFYHPDLFLNINRQSDLNRLPSGFGHE